MHFADEKRRGIKFCFATTEASNIEISLLTNEQTEIKSSSDWSPDVRDLVMNELKKFFIETAKRAKGAEYVQD